MEKIIYKYPLETRSEQVVLLPTGARILTVQQRDNNIFLCALVNPTSQNDQAFNIRIYGTGQEINDIDELEYINSVQLFGGRLVIHVFVKR